MKVNCFLICDDIRNEIGNKQSLIGVYDDAINFSVPQSELGKWPKVIKLGVYIKLEFDSDTERENFHGIKLYYASNDEEVVVIDNQAPLPSQMGLKGLNIAAVINQCVITKTENIFFNFSVYGKNNDIIAEFQKKIMIQEQALKQNDFA